MTHYTNTGNPIDFPKLSAIDKLWGQALDQAVPGTYSSLSLTQVEKVKTVFAELIVRECIEQLEIGKRCDPYTGELFVCERNADIDYEIAVLKEHFGVEE